MEARRGATRAPARRSRSGQPRHGVAPEARLGVGADGQLRQDKHLPAIAAMLDEEQFDLIARPSAGLVAIQGSAGSGKTTVGLHRVAYLAFAEPQRFRARRDARRRPERGARALRGARAAVARRRGRAGDDVRALRVAARGRSSSRSSRRRSATRRRRSCRAPRRTRRCCAPSTAPRERVDAVARRAGCAQGMEQLAGRGEGARRRGKRRGRGSRRPPDVASQRARATGSRASGASTGRRRRASCRT